MDASRPSLFALSPSSASSAARAHAHPKEVGDASQAMILGRLVQAGKKVLVPFGENSRYDYVIEEPDGSFTRVQCKTGRLRNGGVVFRTCSLTYHHPNNRGTRAYRHHYRGQADVFAVYCRELDTTYLIPVGAVGLNTATLRVTPTRNNQSKKIRWASEFELPKPG